jgi:MFS family permease
LSNNIGATAPRAQTHTLALVAAIAAGVIGGCAFAKMSPALPLLKRELGLTLIQAGWLASAFNALAMVSAIVFGVLSDRAGALRFCVSGLACIATGGVLGAAASGAPLLIVSRLVEGVGFIAIIVSAPGLITLATTPAQRGVAFGFWSSYMPFGSAVVIVLSPLLLAQPDGGWRSLWLLVSLTALAGAALLASQRRHYGDGGNAAAPRSLTHVRSSLSQPVPWLLGIVFAAYTTQNVSMLIWLPTYLQEVGHVAATAAAMLTALAIFCNCFGNVFGGWLVQRGVPRGRIIISTFCLTSVLFAGIFATSLPDGLRYALVLVYNAVTGMVPAAAISGAARYARSPAEAGTLQGLVMQLANVGIFSGPPLVAAVVTWKGSWNAALWVMLGCALIGITGGLLIGRRERHVVAA